MLSKKEKEAFVNGLSAELNKYSTIGIINLSGIPDRLLQKSRNRISGIKLVFGRKTLLKAAMEKHAKTKKLAESITGTSAILLSNSDPFDIYKEFKSNEIKLAAKPRQIAPSDISISSGETALQPGQAVTELKQAGIDVQIQKGKVVISKDKVIVKKGEPISSVAAKVLHTLGTMPFTAVIEPSVVLSGGLTFTKELLDIDESRTIADISGAFRNAYALCIERGIVNEYTVRQIVSKAYMQAMALGIETKAYEPGIIEHLLGIASAQATALNGLEKKAQE
ncbi:MAG: 50S ribosomal protein L10 [Candidatus Marsarchaeota archaeon]|jgi:large subunit ribosomal protein L10|nr:50S ribosomal protein L10 [Candidatus Marsarchaeota archaeon]MCL5115039.1 50S ribosomal protein L10 [Candidatus Marsarchaeota archaeon]